MTTRDERGRATKKGKGKRERLCWGMGQTHLLHGLVAEVVSFVVADVHLAAISPVSVHNESDMLRDGAALECFDGDPSHSPTEL